MLLSAVSSNAQNWNEWFKQKKTQKRYLLQQIAALKVYIDYAQKGYSIASKGLTTIRDIKNGDYNLHRDFLGSLKLVNNKIKRYGKVADIIAFQLRIVKESKQGLRKIRETGQLTGDEIDYCTRVFDLLMGECLKNIDELLQVITSGELEMKDDERIKRIDKLYIDMQNKYGFCAHFSNEMAILVYQRMGEQSEINRSRAIDGLPALP